MIKCLDYNVEIWSDIDASADKATASLGEAKEMQQG